jgi:hypothetical protein
VQLPVTAHFPAPGRCAVASGITLKAGAALGQDKATQKQASYVANSKTSGQTCAGCQFFIAPKDCSLVQGPVSWCN